MYRFYSAGRSNQNAGDIPVTGRKRECTLRPPVTTKGLGRFPRQGGNVKPDRHGFCNKIGEILGLGKHVS